MKRPSRMHDLIKQYRYVKKMKAAGKCVDCRRPQDCASTWFCKRCLIKRREKQRERRRTRVEREQPWKCIA